MPGDLVRASPAARRIAGHGGTLPMFNGAPGVSSQLNSIVTGRFSIDSMGLVITVTKGSMSAFVICKGGMGYLLGSYFVIAT